MDSRNRKNSDLALQNRRLKLILAILVAGALMYFLSPWIAKVFLEVSKSANESAYYDVLSEYMAEAEFLSLPTLTPQPTYTPFPTPTNTPTPTPMPAAFIIQRLETQSQLVVVKDEVAKRNFHVGVKDGICSHGGDFTAQGVIEGGIDFDELNQESVSYNSRKQTYTLKLPAPELTSCRIEYVRLVENSFSMCNPDWDRARTLAEVQVMDEFVKRSIEDGLLDDAAEKSKLILGEFVRTLTGKRVEVTFEEQRRSPKRDSSCRPTAGGGWRYNRTKNEWSKR
ncbi:MAG: DUF4230 domain-containing protein [Chloroflexi bacterium]|nr:DUF4230 domain-containing protein [Chloroflexota bacterium]